MIDGNLNYGCFYEDSDLMPKCPTYTDPLGNFAESLNCFDDCPNGKLHLFTLQKTLKTKGIWIYDHFLVCKVKSGYVAVLCNIYGAYNCSSCGTVCKPGYTGNSCSNCEPGYYRHQDFQGIKCTNDTLQVI